MKPLNNGHLWVLKDLSVIDRCPLLGNDLKEIVRLGSKRFARYSWHVHYLECPLLEGFTVYWSHCWSLWGIFQNNFGRGISFESNYGHSLQHNRESCRPKSDACRCEGRDGQSFLLCGSHKWMTPNWKDCRNLCKDLKFLICAFYVSKLKTNYL